MHADVRAAIALAIFVLILVVATVLSAPRRVGDGNEYMAMAMNIAEGQGPSLSPSRLAALETRLAALGDTFNLELDRPHLVRNDGTQDFAHFWLYSAMAAPSVALAQAIGIHPNYGFALLNGLLLCASFFVVARATSAAVALVLFVGPVVWWIDKAHTEPFTFALVAVAFAVLRSHPWWSMVAIAVASTQNPPIALALPVIWLTTVAVRPGLLWDRRLWVCTGISAVIAMLHPLYYLSGLGVYTPQVLGGAEIRVPTGTEFLAVITDLNIGLIPNYPLWAFAVIALGVIPLARSQQLRNPWLIATAVCGLIFMFGASQTTHFNSGGQGPSRYALWLIPLAVPAFGLAVRVWPSWAKRLALATAIVGVVWAWIAYQPSIYEGRYLEPTPIADFVWRELPFLDNPLPEIFYARTAHHTGPMESVATATCSKVLLVNGRPVEHCPLPVEIPQECARRGAVCFANRLAASYEFLDAAGKSSERNAFSTDSADGPGGPVRLVQ
jgi:hypothetical protein